MAKERTTASDDAAPVAKSEKMYRVVFKQNRSFECTVGREFLRFEAGCVNPVLPVEYKDGVPEKVVNHPDFQIHAASFAVVPL